MFNYKKIKFLLIRCLLSIIIFLIFVILLSNDSIYYKMHDILFGSSIDFAYVKSKSKFLIGNILGNKTSFVTSEKLEYSEISKFNNSSKLKTGSNYVVTNLESGIVIYIGEKELLGKTVIILGDDQVNYWYSNIENISVNTYDYIKSGTIIGSTIDEYLYLTMIKDDKYIYYEEDI